MSRFFRFNLAQALLLVALAAFVIVLVTDIRRYHLGVTSNHPALAMSPQDDVLAMNVSFRRLFDRSHPVLVSDLQTLAPRHRQFEAHNWVVSDVAWTADGTQIISTGGDRTIRFWDAATGDELKQISTASHQPSCLAISPDGHFLATGGRPLVQVWNSENGKAVASLKGHKRWPWAVAFSPDGRYLATACIDSQLLIWETSTWKQVGSTELSTATRHLAFTPDGRLLTGGYKSKTASNPWQCNVSMYEVPSVKLLEELPIEKTWAAVSAIGVSRDGTLLGAAHGGDRDLAHCAVTIWNLSSNRELKTIEVDDHGDHWIDALAFSNDGETVYCGSMDGRVTAQKWRSEQSSVVFRRRPLPWRLVFAFGFIWLAAWTYVLRRRTNKARSNAPRTADLQPI